MDEKIIKLQKEFLKIKRMEYIKSVRKGNTGIGATFEYLLNKNEDDLEIPDYYGIEIKTKRSYSRAYITLFNAVPNGSGYYEVKRLRDTYGYRDPVDHNLKQLYVVLSADKISYVGLLYGFKIRVDKENEKVYLEVYDRYYHLIDDSTYWDFDILLEKLERKLQVLAVVKGWPKKINDVEYFKYYDMKIYLLRDSYYFIDSLCKGKVSISLKIGNYRDAKRYGMVSSHGVGFCMKEDDLLELFELYR